jgi:hypothetical protein
MGLRIDILQRAYLSYQSKQRTQQPEGQKTGSAMSYKTGADTPVCFNCGKAGHVRKHCREKGEAGKGQSTTPFHCFKCGDTGHRIRACDLSDEEAAKVSPQSRGWKVYKCEHCKQTLQSQPPVGHLAEPMVPQKAYLPQEG